MKPIYKIFNKYKNNIVIFSESIFTMSMIVLIALDHSTQNFVGTHPYKLFASFFLAFGLLTYILKNHSFIQLFIDLIAKSITIILAAIIIAKLTNTMDLNRLTTVIYPISIMILFLIHNRKSTWKINGENKKCSSREYLLEKYGKTVSILPIILIFIAILLPGILNLSTSGFVISLVIAFVIEQIIVFVLEKNYKELRN